MEIRAYMPEDNKNFLNFYEELIKENDAQMLTGKEMAELIAKDEKKLENKHKYRQIFIAEENGKIIGYLALKHTHFEKIRHIAKFSLGYLKDYQEKENVGSKLVEYAQNWADQNNVRRLEILVMDEDDNLEDLLDDLDFKKEGKRKHSIKIKDKFHDQTIMVKEL